MDKKKKIIIAGIIGGLFILLVIIALIQKFNKNELQPSKYEKTDPLTGERYLTIHTDSKSQGKVTNALGFKQLLKRGLNREAYNFILVQLNNYFLNEKTEHTLMRVDEKSINTVPANKTKYPYMEFKLYLNKDDVYYKIKFEQRREFYDEPDVLYIYDSKNKLIKKIKR